MTADAVANFGNGPATPVKLERVAKILPWVIKMSARHLQRFGGRFCYFEPNAGPGRYVGTNGHILDGSPIVGLLALERLDVPYRAVLIEREPDRYEALCAELRRRGLLDQKRVSVHCADNRTVLPLACQHPCDRRDRGLIFFDPKGAPDWGLIDAVTGLPEMARIDVLVNIPTNTLKMERKAAQSERFGGRGYAWDRKDVRPLRARLDVLHKPRLLIGEPTRDRLAWSLILGSSWPGFPEWRAGGMDASDGPIGGERLERISLTEGERQALREEDAQIDEDVARAVWKSDQEDFRAIARANAPYFEGLVGEDDG